MLCTYLVHDVYVPAFSVLSNTRLVECGKLEIIATEKSSRALLTTVPVPPAYYEIAKR
jgi:hypothetical protein